MRSFFFVAERLGIRVSCSEGREWGALMLFYISSDFPSAAQQQMKTSFKAWLSDSVGKANLLSFEPLLSRQHNFSFSESLAQDLPPPQLLLFKTQPWPPSKPECVVTVRVWLHANCCGVLG